MTPSEPAALEPAWVVTSVADISRRSFRPSVASTSGEELTGGSSIVEASFTRAAAPISWAAVGRKPPAPTHALVGHHVPRSTLCGSQVIVRSAAERPPTRSALRAAAAFGIALAGNLMPRG